MSSLSCMHEQGSGLLGARVTVKIPIIAVLVLALTHAFDCLCCLAGCCAHSSWSVVICWYAFTTVLLPEPCQVLR